MDIRPAGPENYGDYCRLIAELDQELASKDPHIFKAPQDPVRTEEFYQKFFGPENGVLMAFDGESAIGLLNYGIGTPDYPVAQPRKVFFIPMLVVSQACTREGVGKALMAAARKCAEEHGCDDIEFAVQEFNTRAIAFYEKEGFICREKIMTMPVSRVR